MFVFSHWFAPPPCLLSLSLFYFGSQSNTKTPSSPTPLPKPPLLQFLISNPLSPTPHHSTTMTTLRSGISYAVATCQSNSLSGVSESEGGKGTQEEDADCSLTGDSLLLTIGSDSSPFQRPKRRKQRKDSLESPSDTDESTSSKFPRSRANSEDSPVTPEDEMTTIPKNRLFVGGIPLQLHAPQITEIFSQFGKVKHVIVLKNKYGTSKVLVNSLLSHPFHRTELCR